MRPEGFDLVRSLGPFAAVADRIEELNLGGGEVVQVVEGAQEGLLLSWQEPRSGRDFRLAGAVELDRPDVAVAVRADRAWLRWPSSVLAESVTLRVWAAPPSAVPQAWERDGRSEVVFLKANVGLAIPTFSTGVLISEAEVEAVQRYHSVGDRWLRRWSGLVGHINVNLGVGAPGHVNLQMRVRHSSGGAQYVAVASATSRTNWELGVSADHRCRVVDWPLPAQPWRLQIPNIPGSADLTVDAQWMLTTGRGWNGGQRT